MNASQKTNVATKSPATPKPKRQPHGLAGGSEEANRVAVVILEVLAGGRTPADAATALGVTAPRYYQLETRALQGLVSALETKPKGKTPSPQTRIAQLEKALQEARRECLRHQALVRASQRSLGIKAPPVVLGKSPDKDAAGRRKRRPAVRALRAVRALTKKRAGSEAVEALQQSDQSSGPAVCVPDGAGSASGQAQAVPKESQDGACRTQAPGAPPG